MATKIPNKLYVQYTNGQPSVSVQMDYSMVPNSQYVASQNTPITSVEQLKRIMLNSQIDNQARLDRYSPTDSYYQQLKQRMQASPTTFIGKNINSMTDEEILATAGGAYGFNVDKEQFLGQQFGDSGYSILNEQDRKDMNWPAGNGNFVQDSTIDYAKQYNADIKSGKLVQIGTFANGQPAYVPANSPAALQSKGVTPTAANVAPEFRNLFTPGGTTTTATTPAPSITQDMKVGSSGDEVKALQKWLISQGYSIPAGATGYYGEQTKAAVSQWQNANKIDTKGGAGSFGPISRAFINQGSAPSNVPGATPQVPGATPTAPGATPVAGASTSGTQWDSMINGDPLLSEYLKDPLNKRLFDSSPEELKGNFLQTARGLQKAIEAGKIVNPNITITPEKLKEFYDTAHSQLDPYYKEQFAQIRGGLDESISRMMQDYQKTVTQSEKPFQETLKTAATTEAESGTVYSSGRVKRERDRIIEQNRQLADLSQGVERSARDLGVAYERKVGTPIARTLNMPKIAQYQVGGRGRLESAGERQLFNTGDLTGASELGTLGAERATAIENRKSSLEDIYRRNRTLNTTNLA